MLLMTLTAVSFATTQPDPVSVAEYHRLRGEVHKLVERQAWTGVERAFEGMVDTGVELRFSDWVAGATAARELGMVSEARERLWQAHLMQESPEVLDWLWDIDQRFGAVELRVDPSKEGLVVEQPPFEPTARRAIDNAQARLDAQGEYRGLLPRGEYQLGEASFHVSSRYYPVKIEAVDEPKRGLFRRWRG